MARARSTLGQVILQLEKFYGAPRPPLADDPFELLLLENIAYLVSDERREQAFQLLRKLVGVKPHEILAGSNAELLKIASQGGMHPEKRVTRLREVALITLEAFGGDLKSVLKLPLAKAKKALRKFPGIGEPGAEKILLLTRSHPVLSLDSNALRVLLRLGFGEEKKDYTATYRRVQESIHDQITPDYDWLIAASQLLRRHGKELCKTNRPLCDKCPLTKSCRYFNQLSRP